MPFEWTDPELLVEHKGIEVYRTYRDQMMGGMSEYVFTTEPSEDDRDSCSGYVFDIRDLVKDLQGVGVEDLPDDAATVVQIGIDHGLVSEPPHLTLGRVAEEVGDASLLEGLVHETLSSHGSNVNSEGPRAQLGLLVDHIGLESTLEQVRRLLEIRRQLPN